MDLKDALAGIRTYSHVGNDKAQPAVTHLREVRTELEAVPPGLTVRVSGSGQSLPTVAWIALLDPDVTTTAKRGIYLVYLRSIDGQRIYLSLNQGVTWHEDHAVERGLTGVKSRAAAIEELSEEASLIRNALDSSRSRLNADIDLASDRTNMWLPAGYEAGNIHALEYEPDALPTAADLSADLAMMNRLYMSAVDAKARLIESGQVTSPTSTTSNKDTRIGEFRPKDSSDYFVQIERQSQRKTRRHEALIKDFGIHAQERGYTADTNVHPRDLLVSNSTSTWLVEAKTVGISARDAVREAVGQLFEYKHFYHLGDSQVSMLALFSDEIGGAYEDMLISLGIEFVIRTRVGWRASIGAAALG